MPVSSLLDCSAGAEREGSSVLVIRKELGGRVVGTSRTRRLTVPSLRPVVVDLLSARNAETPGA